MGKKNKTVVEKIFTEDGKYFYLSNRPEVLFSIDFERKGLPNISKTRFENIELYGKVIFLDYEHYTYEKAKNITFTFHKPYDVTRASKRTHAPTLDDYKAYEAKKVRTAIMVPIVIIILLSIICDSFIGGLLGFGYLSPILLPLSFGITAFLNWLHDKEFKRRGDIEASRQFRRNFNAGMIGAYLISRLHKRK